MRMLGTYLQNRTMELCAAAFSAMDVQLAIHE